LTPDVASVAFFLISKLTLFICNFVVMIFCLHENKDLISKSGMRRFIQKSSVLVVASESIAPKSDDTKS